MVVREEGVLGRMATWGGCSCPSSHCVFTCFGPGQSCWQARSDPAKEGYHESEMSTRMELDAFLPFAFFMFHHPTGHLPIHPPPILLSLATRALFGQEIFQHALLQHKSLEIKTQS